MVKPLAPDMAFAEWLSAQLEQRRWGIRTLARKIDPEFPEVPRRALNRYMRGSKPSEFYAQAIAEALGISRDLVPVAEATGPDPFRGHGSGANGASSRDRGADGRAGTRTAGDVAA